MIGSTRSVSVFAYGEPTDLRRGFDGLSSLVTGSLSLDVLSGDLYLFVSRNRKRAKVLFWDGTGLCVYGKRLERGRFTAVWSSPDESQLRLTVTELQLFPRRDGAARAIAALASAFRLHRAVDAALKRRVGFLLRFQGPSVLRRRRRAYDEP